MADEERPEPYVKITRVGRWVHEVNLMIPKVIVLGGYLTQDGRPGTTRLLTMTNNDPWLAFGRRHAERLGERKLRKHIRREAWRAS